MSVWVGTHHRIYTLPESICQYHSSGFLTVVPKVGVQVLMSPFAHRNPEMQRRCLLGDRLAVSDTDQTTSDLLTL